MTFSRETNAVLERFRELSAIPRPSKKEQKIGAWLKQFAESRSWQTRSDNAGNIVIKVPASPGREHEQPVVLQGHQDMVCEKTPDSTHDFETQGIKPVVKGEWLHADGTTLGADNGIAIAIGLALAEDEEVSHPPLELLFTVDEETGLTGASDLDPDLLEGRTLINIDSEDEGVLTVGCAGGTDVRIHPRGRFEKRPAGAKAWRVTLSGFSGGHSGVQIAEKRANANVLLGRTLSRISAKGKANIVEVNGGNAHNAIPRDAYAVIWTKVDNLDEVAQEMRSAVASDYGSREPNASVSIEAESTPAEKCLSHADSVALIDMLCGLPHGVAMMSPDIEGLVETSSNVATVTIKADKSEVGVSVRGSNSANLNAHVERISAIARLAGAEAKVGNGYPSWEPNMSSPLLQRCRRVYENRFKRAPTVEAIHAGLECGVIGSKFDGMDMISIGPTIRAPHSPDEALYIPSVDKIYTFVKDLLSEPVGGGD